MQQQQQQQQQQLVLFCRIGDIMGHRGQSPVSWRYDMRKMQLISYEGPSHPKSQPNRAKKNKREQKGMSSRSSRGNINIKRKIYVLSIQLQFSSSIEAFRNLPAGSFEICQKHSHTHNGGHKNSLNGN